MIELISAAKVGKISETNVSLPEKYVSNQENVRYLSRGRDERERGETIAFHLFYYYLCWSTQRM